jgi:hypothetical protein
MTREAKGREGQPPQSIAEAIYPHLRKEQPKPAGEASGIDLPTLRGMGLAPKEGGA